MFEKLTQPQARRLYVLLDQANALLAGAYKRNRREYAETGSTRAFAEAKQDLHMIMDNNGLKNDLRPFTNYVAPC